MNTLNHNHNHKQNHTQPSPEQLNAQFAIDSRIQFITGQGGFAYISIDNPHAQALISLYGGQVLSYRPTGEAEDLMFLSERAHYTSGLSIKGGAPICWPWFGVDRSGLNRGTHGFARQQFWQVVSTQTLADGASEVVLQLKDSEDSLALWPHSFELRTTINVGASLKISLSTHNTGGDTMHLTQAIHTYFNIGAIEQVQVEGLAHTNYIDHAVGGNQAIKPQIGAIAFEREVDRVYIQAPATLYIIDSAWRRRIQIQTSGSRSAVVWNPWVEIAAQSVDLDDSDYQKFICVETANAADDVISIAPNGYFELGAEYRIMPI